MNLLDPPRSPKVLEQARAYVRVDHKVVASLPRLGEAIRVFEPVVGAAGESVARWLTERALREPQEATVRLALAYIGATVLVVDPFDRDTAEMWRQRFGFEDSEQPVPGNHRLRRQWLSLQS